MCACGCVCVHIHLCTLHTFVFLCTCRYKRSTEQQGASHPNLNSQTPCSIIKAPFAHSGCAKKLALGETQHRFCPIPTQPAPDLQETLDELTFLGQSAKQLACHLHECQHHRSQGKRRSWGRLAGMQGPRQVDTASNSKLHACALGDTPGQRQSSHGTQGGWRGSIHVNSGLCGIYHGHV